MNDYKNIIKHYENCYKQYGDTPEGVDWTKPEQAPIRYEVMLDVIKFHNRESLSNEKQQIRLLDFGCGLGHMYDYIKSNNIQYIKYCGLEVSDIFYNVMQNKYSEVELYKCNLLENSCNFSNDFDYVVMNGVFTEKRDLTYKEMFDYFGHLLSKVFAISKKGVAFNLMSKHVDWEKEYLFHVPFDELTSYLIKNITRNFIIRNDYGLYEYTVYLYK